MSNNVQKGLVIREFGRSSSGAQSRLNLVTTCNITSKIKCGSRVTKVWVGKEYAMKRSLQKHFVENPPEILKKVREC
jgi:hypothetical protein